MTNPDRTHRNSNLLIWNRQPWLIDHGAALYAHHDWQSVDDARTRTPFPLIRDHVLLARSADLELADASLSRTFLGANVIRDAVAAVPDSLLDNPVVQRDFATPQAARDRYVSYLEQRLDTPHLFLAEAVTARARALSDTPRRVSARR